MARGNGALRRIFSFFVALAALAAVPAAAQAAPGIAVAPSLPSSVQVGQVGLAGSVTVTAVGDPVPFPMAPGKSIGICTNSPAPADSGCQVIGTPWDSGLTVTPSCGQTVAPAVTAPACTTADKDVFRLSATALGATGTACAGIVFDVSTLDATKGMYRLAPRPFNSYVSLGAPGSACRADFTFDVLKTPTVDADPSTAGAQTRALTSAGGWYWADNKKKVGPLKAVGSVPVTVTTAPPPPCTPPNPACPTPTPTCTPPDPNCTPPTVTPTPTCTPPDPNCTPPNPPVERMQADLSVSCTNRSFTALVRVQGNLNNLVRVLFIRDGRPAASLPRPNQGLNRFAYSGSIKSLKQGRAKFRARVVVRQPGTFARTGETYVRTARLGALRLNARREGCLKPPPPVVQPKLVRATIRSEVGCIKEGYSVTVSTSGARKLVRRVQFTISGGRTRTLGRPNSGGSYVISGQAAEIPEFAEVTANVLLRKPGSFKRKTVVLRKSLRSGLQVQQKCGPDPTPGRR